MDCNRVVQLISAYADDELKPRERAQAEEHLRNCPKCAAALENISVLKSAISQGSLQHRAPAALHDRILQLVDEAVNEPLAQSSGDARQIGRWAWIAAAIAAALLIAIGLSVYLTTPSRQMRLATEAVWNHKRSLLADHLVDIRSSDPKKVSVWLNARLAFEPWVPDEPPAGYVLVGARMDILDGRDVAALVYNNDGEFINIFEWPALPKVAITDLKYTKIQDYNVGYWSNPAWNFYTVSSGDPLSIQPLTQMFVAQSCAIK